MTRAPRWLKPINKIYMLLLRRGVHFGAEQPVILTVRGRSGKPRSTPITPMEIDGQRYIVAVFADADWVANVRAAEEVTTLTDGRYTKRAWLLELPPHEARPVLRLFPVQVPAGVGFLKNSGLVSEGTPEELEGLAGVLPVFRVDPV
jgi:hypothetical protein